MAGSLWLRSEHLSIEVRPDKGGDITSIIDRASGIDVLFRAPWKRPSLATTPLIGDSQVDWLARYGGGWQQLIPNAGRARVVDGVTRGYHGEAAVIAWYVHSANDGQALLATDLLTAPLHLTRALWLDGDTLSITDSVENTSDDPVSVMWVQHPGFGAPFIDERCTLTTGARTVITDAEAPGNLVSADIRSSFPLITTTDGRICDLRKIPGATTRRSLFACLTDFEEGWFAIESPTAGFGVRVGWDTALFPHAWLWQECHATPGHPWHGRAYVVAVEPANVIPGDRSEGCGTRGAAPLLPPRGAWTSSLVFTRIPL